MARTRLVNPKAPMDEDVATMSLAARYAWAYLPCHADREGRLRDSAFFLRAAIFPNEPVDMEAILRELAEKRHIVRYKAEGRSFIQIRSFVRHQAPHARETASEIPPPPEQIQPQAEPSTAFSGTDNDLGNQDLQRVATSPSCSGSGSVSSGSPLTLVASSPDPERAPVAMDDPDHLWTANEWRQKYALAWTRQYGGTMGGGTPAAIATGELAERLAELPAIERLSAQARSTVMFAEFLAETAPAVVKARHPWSWLVTRFDSLRAPMGRPRAGPAPDVRVGHAMAEVKQRVSGEVKL